MPARQKSGPGLTLNAKSKTISPRSRKTLRANSLTHSSSNPLASTRLLVDADGVIRCAEGSAVRGSCGMRGCDILEFVFPDDAMRDRPVMAAHGSGDPWFNAIQEGDHPVRIIGLSRPHAATMHFERLRLPDGREFLVADMIETDAAATGDLNTAPVRDVNSQDWAVRHIPLIETPVPETKLSVEEMSAFLDMTHDLIALTDQSGRLLCANATFCQTLGYERDGVTRFDLFDFVHPDDRASVRANFKHLTNRSSDEQSFAAFEARAVAQSGLTCHLEWRLKRIGTRVHAVCRDLTASKTHADELIRRQRQMSEAQAIGHMGHWRWQIGNDAIDFSDEIFRIFDAEPDTFHPTIKSVNSRLHRRDVGRMEQAFQRAMIERKNYEMEFRVIRPDGKVRFIALQGRCEIDAEGDVAALFGIMQDVTDHIEQQRELRHAKESVERAYAAKSQFLANMSHELRTPLNAIIGFSEMIERQLLGPVGTEKYLDYIANIRNSGEHLLDLITDILDMSKIEAGKYRLDIEEFNLSKVIRLANHMIEGRALDAQIKILCDMRDDTDILVKADRRAVTQILLNLLSNAVKFTENGGEVRTDCRCDEDEITISVSDTGIGIPSAKLRFVTEPFEQAANHFTRNHEGSGLGLTITKDLVELHGGSMTIESTIGVGTCVTFRLPIDCREKRRDLTN